MKEKEIIDIVRKHIQDKWYGRLFRRNSALLPDGRGGRLRANYVGQADLDGFAMLEGSMGTVPCYLAVEVKTKGKDLSNEQKKVKAAFDGMGVIYSVVREETLDEDLAVLDHRLRHFEHQLT